MIDVDSILVAVQIILDNEEAGKTTISSLQSAVVTGVSTFLGAVLFGPVGIIAGASAGSLGMYSLKKASFKPIHRVISEDLNPAERRRLGECVQNVVSEFEVQDAVKLMILARSDVIFQNAVKNSVTRFLASNSLPSTR